MRLAVDATTGGLRGGHRAAARRGRQGPRRALGRGRLRPARPPPGQRRRLRLDLRQPATTPPRCTGSRTPVTSTDGDVLLLDAGVEVDSLYTADITRTLPVDGTFTEAQRKVYDAVYAAQEAGHGGGQAGGQVHRDPRRRDPGHRRAPPRVGPAARGRRRRGRPWTRSTASTTAAGWCTAPATTSGIDVHDCAQARREPTTWTPSSSPGMVLTVEPGLYFKADDLLVPEELRGIGVRIEDDVLVTEDGYENLSGRRCPGPPTTSRPGSPASRPATFPLPTRRTRSSGPTDRETGYCCGWKRVTRGSELAVGG